MTKKVVQLGTESRRMVMVRVFLLGILFRIQSPKLFR